MRVQIDISSFLSASEDVELTSTLKTQRHRLEHDGSTFRVASLSLY